MPTMLRNFLQVRSPILALKQGTIRRMICSTPLSFKAEPFLMPAMSPTMEKGGIVSWKYKPGESFSAGDVLLEVETDKAQIDVEAQDDGQMAKIIIGDGTKDIDVGTTIAYIGDPEDNLETLEYPDARKEQKTSQETGEANQEPKKQAVKDNEGSSEVTSEQQLLPSVSILLAHNNISKKDAIEKIKPSGSNGNILKGDVLAYLGKISPESVDKISKYVKKNEKLDLSNIIVMKPEEIKETNTSNDGMKEQPEPNKATISRIPNDIEITESIIISVPDTVSINKLKVSVDSFIKEAYEYSHNTPLFNTLSDHYDPLFEDLLVVEPRNARFRFTYDLQPLHREYEPNSGEEVEDIFDLLSEPSNNSDSKGNRKIENPNKREFVLSFDMDVFSKYQDSKDKAERFIHYIRQLEVI